MITNQQIVDSIISLSINQQNPDIDIILKDVGNASRRRKDSVWFLLVQKIFSGCKDPRTIQKYVSTCWARFRNYRQEIEIMVRLQFEKLKTNKETAFNNSLLNISTNIADTSAIEASGSNFNISNDFKHEIANDQRDVDGNYDGVDTLNNLNYIDKQIDSVVDIISLTNSKHPIDTLPADSDKMMKENSDDCKNKDKLYNKDINADILFANSFQEKNSVRQEFSDISENLNKERDSFRASPVLMNPSFSIDEDSNTTDRIINEVINESSKINEKIDTSADLKGSIDLSRANPNPFNSSAYIVRDSDCIDIITDIANKSSEVNETIGTSDSFEKSEDSFRASPIAFHSSTYIDEDSNSINRIVNEVLNESSQFNEKIVSKKYDTKCNNGLQENFSHEAPKNVKKHWKYEDPGFYIPPSFWQKYLTSNNNVSDGWTDGLNGIFEKHNKFCVLSFRWHKCYMNKRGVLKFQAVAKCKFSTCTSFRFSCEFNPKLQESEILKVFRNSEIKHLPDECHSRFLKGEKRKACAADLQNMSAVEKKYKLLDAADKEKLRNGNLNDVVDSQRLHKVRSEDKAKRDLSENTDEFMKKLISLYEVKWRGLVFNNFIQDYGIKPFRIILFTEAQLNELLSIKKGNVFCHLDSTGKLIAKPDNESKVVYYYTLLLSSSEKNDDKITSFPVAELITNQHAVPYVQHFLNVVNLNAKSLSSRTPIIDKIETDFSLALLQAISQAFNKIPLIDYVNFVYNGSIRLKEMTVIHICSSHMIKTGIREMKKLSLEYSMRITAKKILALMIHSTSEEILFELFEVLWKLFTLPLSDDEKQHCLDYIENCDPLLSNKVSNDLSEVDSLSEDDILDPLKESSIEENQSNDFPDETSTDMEELLTESSKRTSSHYYNEASKRIKELEKNFTPEDLKLFRLETSLREDITLKDSELINEVKQKRLKEKSTVRFGRYILAWWMPYVALWSPKQIIQFGKTRDSNAAIEDWHKVLKNFIFDKESNISFPRFVQKQEELLSGRIVERNYNLKTERRKRNFRNKPQFRDDETAEEVWKPKVEVKEKRNKYFTMPKNINDNDITNETVKQNVSTKAQNKSDTFSNYPIQDEVLQNPAEDENIQLPIDRPNVEEMIMNARELLFSPNLDYPADYPNIQKEIRGYFLDKWDFETLAEKTWVTDNIINCFGSILVDDAELRNKKVIFFETLFIESLVAGISDGFAKWLEKQKWSECKCWIFPLHLNRNHWALLIVDFNSFSIMYLDSLHFKMRKELLDKIMTLIEIYGENVTETEEKKWVLHEPKDIPLQEDGYNCGIHVCLWMFIILKSIPLKFNQKDMKNARKGICRMIVDAELERIPVSRKRTETKQQVWDNVSHEKKGKKLMNKKYRVASTNKPPQNFSTTLEYCAQILNNRS